MYRVLLTLAPCGVGISTRAFTVYATDRDAAIAQAKMLAGDSVHLRVLSAEPETFETTMARVKALPAERQESLREEALAELHERLAGTGEGIGSSDVNHVVVSIARAEGI